MASHQGNDEAIPSNSQESEPTISAGSSAALDEGAAISTGKESDEEQTHGGENVSPRRKDSEIAAELLGLNLSEMYFDATGKTSPSVEVWEPHRRLFTAPSPHDSNNIPEPTSPKSPPQRVPTQNTSEPSSSKTPPTNGSNLLDRHNKIMAAILTRFRNMVVAATETLPDAAIIPQASLNAMTMENEASALIKEVENLLALTREIKQLWIVGPLRKPGDTDVKNREKELDEKAQVVSKLHSDLVELQYEFAKRRSVAQQIAAAPKDEQHVEAKKDNAGVHTKHGNQDTRVSECLGAERTALLIVLVLRTFRSEGPDNEGFLVHIVIASPQQYRLDEQGMTLGNTVRLISVLYTYYEGAYGYDKNALSSVYWYLRR
ncbi:hypothetical protein O1611_g1749 [Lasiodiplodia mahajangana]|uniref:Uncharacterized protein n=1 Tax=Lasiodiplodia mahajangana TaxID=1108764 RepID=A0ACC2JWQ2_9PEZI|nr:hypothetical protein O1611_g1749 [Lasiodiplodia mahajangana]